MTIILLPCVSYCSNAAGVDYHFTEITTLISHRLCIDIIIIDDYLPGSAVQFSLIATSRTHRIPTTTSTVVIMDDGMYVHLTVYVYIIHTHLHYDRD